MNLASEFGQKLKSLREEAGLTQAELAKHADVSLRAVTQWERGVREPSWSSVIALANALDVSTEEFRS